MKHYGDITKINGAEAPVVDIITGGSPCQDLSVAGKRAGLAGERSGLFMEQMRIVKEMREHDRANGRTGWMVRPRYMVWENVPGAFSSGNPKGADFAAVIEEIIKVAEPGTSVSVCIPNGGWTKSGCYYAEDGSWSIAWRVHDAQFWGVPQRRKRIALVADFGGLSAPEILFERKGLSGDSEQSGEAGEETSGGTGKSVEGAGGEVAATITATYGTKWNGNALQTSGVVSKGNGEAFLMPEKTSSLAVGGEMPGQGYPCVLQNAEPVLLESNQNHATVQTDGISTALPASMGMGGGYVPMVTAYGISSYDSSQDSRFRPLGDICQTVSATYGMGGNNQPLVVSDAVCVGNGQLNQMSMAEQANTLDTMHDQQAVLIAMASTAAHAEITTDGVSPSLLARAGTGGNNMPNITRGSTVRRLTPLECERLQGYPDGWTDIGEWVDSNGKKHGEADSPRYKALGNSIALPFWQWMARRICAQYERPATMASLFDGIGGFPLVFQRCGAVPVWASEIEEFPIAVTKVRFPDESV